MTDDPDPVRPPLAETAQRRRKRRDAAFALPLAGAFLLASPFLDVFAGARLVFGLPLAVLAIFGTWFALIAAAAALARPLIDDDEAD